jgi:hypothetical protein
MASPVQLFNRSLLDFIDALAPLIGHLPMHTAVAASAKILAHVDEGRNLDYFDRYVASRYGAQITARDESFLLAESYTEAPEDSDIVQLLKATWSTLSPDEKDAIWKHMQVLVLLCRGCRPQQP